MIAQLVPCLNWHRVLAAKPDTDTTVMVYAPLSTEPVWLGYWDSADACWRDISGEELPGVTHWADMPEGPTK
jgi:hypothetical protein